MYPCPPENISLRGLSDLRKTFEIDLVGFSDHSAEMTMAISALALGAVVVEKHFTDSKERIGPDISSSMDASELADLIRWSKEIHFALQNTKKREPVEEPVYRFARSSLVADRDIKKGEKFTKENLWARRPGNGEVAGFEVRDCLGKFAMRNIFKDEQIKRDDVGNG
jgi:N-acetylneuraminate synthase